MIEHLPPGRRSPLTIAAWIVWVAVLSGVAVLVAVLLTRPERQPPQAADVVHADGSTVVYVVEGTAGRVDVSLSGDALGAGVDLHGVALPVEERPGEPYQGVVFPGQYRAEISARIVSGGGEVTCRIVVDGTVEAEMTAAGDGAVAHCSA
jgi:hypothetical protein